MFEVGDLFYLKIKPYYVCMNEKLAARFYGQFEVEARVGQSLIDLSYL